MGLDKKKLVKKLLCGNCKLWQMNSEEMSGMKMGRCGRDERPVMSLSPACNFLDESNFTDRGYKMEKAKE
jgi:hypothetical protein